MLVHWDHINNYFTGVISTIYECIRMFSLFRYASKDDILFCTLSVKHRRWMKYLCQDRNLTIIALNVTVTSITQFNNIIRQGWACVTCGFFPLWLLRREFPVIVRITMQYHNSVPHVLLYIIYVAGTTTLHYYDDDLRTILKRHIYGIACQNV